MYLHSSIVPDHLMWQGDSHKRSQPYLMYLSCGCEMWLDLSYQRGLYNLRMSLQKIKCHRFEDNIGNRKTEWALEESVTFHSISPPTLAVTQWLLMSTVAFVISIYELFNSFLFEREKVTLWRLNVKRVAFTLLERSFVQCRGSFLSSSKRLIISGCRRPHRVSNTAVALQVVALLLVSFHELLCQTPLLTWSGHNFWMELATAVTTQ